MSKADDLKADITEILAKLDETDTDLDTLIALASNGNSDGLTAEQTAEIQALLGTVKSRVSATAEKYPAPPTDA